MSPETRKHLYVGAAIITLAGAAIWMYQKAQASAGSSDQASTDAQAQQAQSDAYLGELALSGGGGFGGGSLGSPGVSTVSPNTVTAPGTDIAAELASIFSSLGVGNTTSPATPTPPPSTPPASTSNPTQGSIPTQYHNNLRVVGTFSTATPTAPVAPVTSGLTAAQTAFINQSPKATTQLAAAVKPVDVSKSLLTRIFG